MDQALLALKAAGLTDQISILGTILPLLVQILLYLQEEAIAVIESLFQERNRSRGMELQTPLSLENVREKGLIRIDHLFQALGHTTFKLYFPQDRHM